MVGRIGLTDLRLACPCAACEIARSRGRSPWPPAGQPETTLTVTDAKLLGYGLGITWSDGHSTGIYAFETLRRWCEGEDEGASTT
jgi:ATP-binding protein involved in chromosome partitioning